MRFWELFKRNKERGERDGGGEKDRGRLYQKARVLLPSQASEDQLIKTTCLAGLLARVAYTDLDIDKNEKECMQQSLGQWMGPSLSKDEVEAVVNLAIEEIQELAGLENHKYCYPLNDLMDTSEKYHLLESLFAIAASDGKADHGEVEEIRVIATGLRLEHKHFIAARATVLKHLQALH